MTDQPHPQPGWYDDPGGSSQERYWEGTRWTKNLRDRPAPIPGVGKSTEGTIRVPQSASPMSRGGDANLTQRGTMPPPQGPGAPYTPGAVPGRYPPQPQGAYKMVRTTADGVPLASFWSRVAATIVDTILMSLIGGLIGWPYLVRAWNAYTQIFDWMLANPGQTVDFTDYDYATPASMVQFAILGVSFVVQVLMVRFFGGTIGQLLMGLRVVPSEKGLTPRVSWNTSLMRSAIWVAIMAASQAVLFPAVISYLRPLWHPRLKTWHDSLAHTQVITTRGEFAKSVLAQAAQRQQ